MKMYQFTYAEYGSNERKQITVRASSPAQAAWIVEQTLGNQFRSLSFSVYGWKLVKAA